MLNLDLSQHNPVQSDGAYANVPLPSAHLVVIEESEMKESVKDGYTKGTNLLLELTILASSTGSESVGDKLALYIPFSGFEETTIRAGMRRLSTLAYTLGVGGYLQNKEDLHGQAFIVVLDKQQNNNFPNFKRILRVDGTEIADASGNFRECNLRDQVLQTELEKLLATVAQGSQQQPVQQQQPVAPQQTFTQPVAQQPAQPSFVPQAGFAPQAQVQQPPQAVAQPAQQPNFGGAVPSQPAWGAAVNPQNGQV